MRYQVVCGSVLLANGRKFVRVDIRVVLDIRPARQFAFFIIRPLRNDQPLAVGLSGESCGKCVKNRVPWKRTLGDGPFDRG